MLIHRIAAQLYTAEALQTVEAGLDAGEDVTLAVSQSGRTPIAPLVALPPTWAWRMCAVFLSARIIRGASRRPTTPW